MNHGRKGTWRFNQDIQDRIIEVISQGNYRAAAAKAVNISEKTLSCWLNSPEKKYQELQKRVVEEEAQIEIRAVNAICEAGDKDAKWWCWFLERKFPKRWGNAVHRWEMQILQRQVKELKNAVKSLAQASEGNQFSDEDCDEAEGSVGDCSKGHSIVCPKQGLQSD